MEEVKDMLCSPSIEVHFVDKKIDEIQSNNMKEIVLDKAIKAFKHIGYPVIVEHTGLLIKDFANLPGGLTQIFWDALEADKFSKIFSQIGSGEATAKTFFAFCDGKNIYTFEGSIEGHIVSPPRGSQEFQWDCVFEPKGYDKTFSELGEKKKDISMRKEALENLKIFLEKRAIYEK